MKKTCATCGIEKDANKSKSSQFYYRKDRKYYYNDCKACRASKGNKTTTRQTREKEAIERNPHGFLAAGIIELAIREHRNWKDGGKMMSTDFDTARALAGQRGYDSPVEEIEAFFESAWFDELSLMCDSDPEYLRKHILEM